MKKIFLDTNSYSRYARGDRAVKDLILRSERIFVSVITMGELYLGFKEGDRERTNMRLLKAFLSESKVEIVNVTVGTSGKYGELKYKLRRKGTPIPDNDIWIAAQVFETGSTLLSYDKHFGEVEGLLRWNKFAMMEGEDE